MKTMTKLAATAAAVLGLALLAGPAGAQTGSAPPQNGAMSSAPMAGDHGMAGGDMRHDMGHHPMGQHMSGAWKRCHMMMAHHRHMSHHQRMMCHSMMRHHMMHH